MLARTPRPIRRRSVGGRHRSQIGRACSHKSRCGTPAPDTAPSSVGRPPGRYGRPPSECPKGPCHRLPSEYRPTAPAEENSFPTTAGSRVSLKRNVLRLVSAHVTRPFDDLDRFYKSSRNKRQDRQAMYRRFVFIPPAVLLAYAPIDNALAGQGAAVNLEPLIQVHAMRSRRVTTP